MFPLRTFVGISQTEIVGIFHQSDSTISHSGATVSTEALLLFLCRSSSVNTEESRERERRRYAPHKHTPTRSLCPRRRRPAHHFTQLASHPIASADAAAASIHIPGIMWIEYFRVSSAYSISLFATRAHIWWWSW